MANQKPILDQKVIEQIISQSRPKSLTQADLPPLPEDHVAQMVQLVLWGQTHLAADHLLFADSPELLREMVSGLIRQLNVHFARARVLGSDDPLLKEEKVRLRHFAYEVLLEISLNFFGLESRHLPEREKGQSLAHLSQALREWEDRERQEGGPSIAAASVRKLLSNMKLVMQGASMQAKVASEIEEGLSDQYPITAAFLQRAKEAIQNNIYYQLVRREKCRFGNDYALGLRWLRHLGYEQVSTNPVLAARAYQDDPRLSQIFQEEARRDPRYQGWRQDPLRYGDEIALYATLIALWDNIHVFRPLFYHLREESGGGVVSFQLNPNIAHLVEESVSDAFSAFQLAEQDLGRYDAHLLAGFGADRERGRANMVIKVAASSPAAREITRILNSFGFGTNITVVFTVAQEVTLILEEMAGMATAVRKGILPTQLYMTNMGGRLESHLREVKLEEFFGKLRDKEGEARATEAVRALAEANGTKDKVEAAASYEGKVLAATRFLHGQRTMDGPIRKALEPIASPEEIQQWESAISMAGTCVARRVWGIFFSRENKRKWISHLMKRSGLSHDQAGLILDRINYLPASKRKAEDTFWTLSSNNMVHTEFPNQQEAVRQMAKREGFRAWQHYESIRGEIPAGILTLLHQMEDFRRAYEINEEIAQTLSEVGIKGDFGTSGLKPEEWAEFGAVKKTLEEFKTAYDKFKGDMVALLQKA
ncbi:MAG: transaldolase family protein [candidate division NC10 bacterium]|nr:transaldolase family protein [candidate division NC10 bacterium]